MEAPPDADAKLPEKRRKGSGVVEIELELSRQRAAGWVVFGIVVGALMIWKLGTVGMWAGVVLVLVGLYRGWQLIQTFLHPPGTIRVSEREVSLPRGLCLPRPITVEPAAVTAVYFLRKSVPWSRAAPAGRARQEGDAVSPRLVRLRGRSAACRARAAARSPGRGPGRATGCQRRTGMIRALVVGLVMLASVARADQVITLPRTKATLRLPAAFTRVERPRVVAGFRDPHGVLVAVTRAGVPNPEAWRAKTRDAYLEQIERGVLASIGGGKRLARSTAPVAGIPTLDLEVRRDDGATIVIRILVFRTYALGLAIELPRKASLDEARAIAKAFAPPSVP